ncbi:MAG: hypothetical protein ABI647_13730 [Gemmatimonadota bacterium]
MIRPIVVSLFLATAAAGVLEAQKARPVEDRRFAIALQLIRSPAWSLREQTGAFINRDAGYDAGWEAGIELGFAPIPAVQLFGGFEANGGGFGDTSGFTAFEGGLSIRPWRRGAVVPFGVASYGRMAESGGVSFGFGTVGVGAEVPLSGLVAVRAAVRRLLPGSASSSRLTGPGHTTSVEAEMTRIHLALVLRF